MKWIKPSKVIKIIIDKEYSIENLPVNIAQFVLIDKGQFEGININSTEVIDTQGVNNHAQAPTSDQISLVGSGYPTIQFCTLVDSKPYVAYQWIFDDETERNTEFDKIIKSIV